MYKISVEQHFDAAHFLRDYHGKCENLHGHRFKVVVTVEADELNEIINEEKFISGGGD